MPAWMLSRRAVLRKSWTACPRIFSFRAALIELDYLTQASSNAGFVPGLSNLAALSAARLSGCDGKHTGKAE